MTVQFKNLTCELGGKNILQSLSGEVFPGKITAVLGANGCGKSTFLRALLGLVPAAGEISGLSSVGYLPQTKEIYWPLTCAAIASLGNQKNVEPVFKRLGIELLLNQRIDQVSGGERTLVLLARVLVDAPTIIIVDEPVAELDPAYQIRVMKILKEEASRGAAVLTTMHDIGLTAKYCDRVLLMKDGEIFKQGAVSETMTETNLTTIFRISFGMVSHTYGRIFYAKE